MISAGKKGQAVGLRGLEVAAAGGHGFKHDGPAGVWGSRSWEPFSPGFLPPMSHEEALETAWFIH
ncbi:MAG: hypothetical protein Ct9H300mP13_5580 [Gammaproteobacteria bacterium]|nr:MAG: hypothetical protein Ct9H300mP13_5580 [Gammaproteobacteria bacterium]